MGWVAAVLNDSSGSGDCAGKARKLAEIFAAERREVRVTVTPGGNQFYQAAKQALDDGCEVLVAGGGDGTISAAASLLVDRDTPLGVLPLGTLNHFAKDLGIPLELEDAVRVILAGSVCRVDVGEVNGRVFINNSSIGVYPAVVRMRERYRAAGLSKWFAALWASLTVLRRHPFMAVRIMADGKALIRGTPFVLVGNNEYKMVGLEATSRPSLVGGHLAVYVMNAERRVGLLRLAWQVLLKGVDEVKEVDLLTVDSTTIEPRRQLLPVALDGEVIPMRSPLEYRIRAGSLRVHVPANTSACNPAPR